MRPSSIKRTLTTLAAAVMAGAALIGVSHVASAAGGHLVVKGSDTMVTLSGAWAEEYMKKHPGTSVSVTGGGSGVGIAQLINGTCELANASRAMKASEIGKCKDKGFVPTPHTVALDGLAIAVHSSNPVRSLSLQQLYGIYTGAVKDWKEVGGRPGAIRVLSRESSSGTYVYFRDFVLKGKNYRADAMLLPTTNAIRQQISTNPSAIGYGGRAYFENAANVKIIPVSAGSGPAVEPTDGNVRSKKYPISRPLFIYSRGKPTGLAADFIAFAKSPEGQRVVAKIGYVALH